MIDLLVGHPAAKAVVAGLTAAGVGLALNDMIVVAVALVVGVFTLIRGRSDIWRSNYEAERARAERLAESEAKARERIATLEAQPSIAKLYEQFADHDRAEREMWQRAEAILNRLDARLTSAVEGR